MAIKRSKDLVSNDLDYQISEMRMIKLGIMKKPETTKIHDKSSGEITNSIKTLTITEQFHDFVCDRVKIAMLNRTVKCTSDGCIVFNDDYWFMLEESIKAWCGDNLSDLDNLEYFLRVIHEAGFKN